MVLLQARLHELIGDDDVATLRLHHELEHVQQLACVAAAVSQEGARLFQFDVALLQVDVGREGAMEQSQEVVLLQRLKHVELASGQQGSDDLEGRVLRRGAYQGDNAALDGSEERVLLGLRETVNLVDEEYGRGFVEESSFLCLLNDFAHILDAAGNGRERIERCLQTRGDNLCQRRLAHARWSPEDERGDAAGVDHPAQHGSLTYQVLLSDIVVERSGS